MVINVLQAGVCFVVGWSNTTMNITCDRKQTKKTILKQKPGLIDPFCSNKQFTTLQACIIKSTTPVFTLYILLYHVVVGNVLCCVVVEKWWCVLNLFYRSGLQTHLLGGLRERSKYVVNS